jgi:AcrR family transcriptional regulator
MSTTSTTSTPTTPTTTGTKLGERRSSARAEAAPAYRARREEIIAAAGKAFLAKGYRATSFRDIADAVGVDRASLYYYFESKHELFRAATSVAVQRNVADAESIAASDASPAEKLAAIFHRLLESFTDRDYPYMFIFLQEDVNGITDDSEDEWAREMNDYNRRYERAVTAVIAEGAERGDFVLPGTPHVMTKTVVGMANWLQHWYRSDGPLSAAEIADVFASTFLYGVVRRDGVEDAA